MFAATEGQEKNGVNTSKKRIQNINTSQRLKWQ